MLLTGPLSLGCALSVCVWCCPAEADRRRRDKEERRAVRAAKREALAAALDQMEAQGYKQPFKELPPAVAAGGGGVEAGAIAELQLGQVREEGMGMAETSARGDQ